MEFSKYLQDYMNAKKLKGGITPGHGDAVKLFAPYFEKRQALDFMLKKQQQAEKEQAAKEKQWSEGLAWEKEKTMKELAQEKALREGGMLTDRDIAMAQLASQGSIAANRLATQSNIAMSGLDWDRQRAADNLAFDMWRNSLLMDAAGRQDSNATWGNIFSSLGSIGSGLILKKYW